MHDDSSVETQRSKRAELARLVTKRLRTPKLAALAVAALVLVSAAIFTFTRAQTVDLGQGAGTDSPLETTIDENLPSSVDVSSARIFVHVIGAVRKPGVLELSQNSRVIDAIEAAGGVVDGAAMSAINLARLVTDGEQINVLTEGQVAAAEAASSGSEGSNGLTNLNTADANTLESLPGVGPALASRIVDWRKANGGFKTVDDLNNVSGIGDKMLENVRSLVTV